MLPENVRAFCSQTHRGVLTAFRRDGAAQMSIVTCGPLKDGVAFTVTFDRAKLLNLKRNRRCSLLVSQENWSGFVVLEGHAEILSADNTDADRLRLTLRDTYRTASGQEHSDWAEYDQAMVDDKRAVIIVVPEHIYGTVA